MHPDDFHSFQRMTGQEVLSAAVEREYALRAGMFHRDGASGSIGTAAMVDFLRFMDIEPPSVPDAPNQVDWRALPSDGSVRVEARYYGAWMPGVYLGGIEGGTLAVRLDGDPTVKECRQHMLRFSDAPMPEDEPVPTGPPEAEEPPEEFPDDAPPAVDWTEVESGAAVWIEDPEDIIDARYVQPAGDKIVVEVRGVEREVDPDTVVLAR